MTGSEEIHIITDVLKNSLLITGLVMVMMLFIEYINLQSAGKYFERLRSSEPRQVLLASILGLIPGCMGGFAAVSLYTHRMISFGALTAMMICSSGDMAFIMLALIPKQALILFGILFIIGIVCGLLIDKLNRNKTAEPLCPQDFEIHEDEHERQPSIFRLESYKNSLRPSKERIFTFLILMVFTSAIVFGLLGHEHGEGIAGHDHHGHFNILSEQWLNIIFGIVALISILFTLTAKEHFIKEHIWGHVIRRHCLKIFLWTFGALAVIQLGTHYMDLEPWIKSNTFTLILLASLIGMIPDSGPHMIFLSLYAAGMTPVSVLLASCISQDGHASLPLLANSKRSFIGAKLLNAVIAILFGCVAMLMGF